MLMEIRCPECGRKLMELCGLARTKCPRCKNLVDIDTTRRGCECRSVR